MSDKPLTEGIEIKKPGVAGQTRVVVPAATQDHTPKKPVPVSNPLLVKSTAGQTIATTCQNCGGRVDPKPGAVPFATGPNRGGFWCTECWILHYADKDIAMDPVSRKTNAENARRIRMRRAGGEDVLYNDGANKAYLTPRGTVLIDLKPLQFGGADEYDDDRCRTLVDMFRAIAAKGVAGYAEAIDGSPKKAVEESTKKPEEKPAKEPEKKLEKEPAKEPEKAVGRPPVAPPPSAAPEAPPK